MVGHTTLRALQSHPISLPSLHGVDGSAPPIDTVNSKCVVGIKPGDSGVVIRYQVDDFTCTWSAECFIAWSHMYPSSTGKVPTLTHFPLKPDCDDYSFLDQAVEHFEHSLDSNLIDSHDTPELGASFDEADAMPSSVSSGFLFLVSTISDTCRLQLAPSIKSHKL